MARGISRDQLRKKIENNEDFVLVDALSPEHYKRSHIPGAVNLPLEFIDEADEVIPNKDSEIVVYCMNTNCGTSKEEARELEEMGYENILHYPGGKQDWLNANLPIESERESRLGGI